MNTNALHYDLNIPRITMLAGLAIGLGIVVHEVSFLVAGTIAAIVPVAGCCVTCSRTENWHSPLTAMDNRTTRLART